MENGRCAGLGSTDLRTPNSEGGGIAMARPTPGRSPSDFTSGEETHCTELESRQHGGTTWPWHSSEPKRGHDLGPSPLASDKSGSYCIDQEHREEHNFLRGTNGEKVQDADGRGPEHARQAEKTELDRMEHGLAAQKVQE